nr:GAF domain-containing protein [Anaerolineae bacterium]
MTPEHRMSIARWIAGIGILTAVGLLWPDIGQYGANDWAALSSAAALIALAVNLGVDTAYGTITFVPVIVLAVYHAFGLKPALSSTSLGLLIGGAAFLTSSWNRLPEKKWWAKVASLPYEIGRSGLSLLAADWANRNLYGQNPLIIIPAFSALLPLVISLLVYLIVYDLIILGDLRLRGISIKEAIQEDRITTLAIQLLPLGLAPFAAITYAQLGILAFGIFELVIFTVVIVVNRLTLAQDRLSERVAQLQSISTMNQLLRTGLELDSLLQTVYLQIASLLKVDNICIVLGKPGISEPLWQPRLICENGRTVERPESRKVDGFSNWVMENGQSLIAESVGQKAQELSISPPPNARSWMGIPLIASRRTMGSLSIWIGLREETGRVFTDKDFEVFSTIAAQTEVSLENAL